MAWRIHEHVLRGEIDNRARGRVTGRIWLAGLDDHSRVVPLARLYPRESLLAHFDFLASTFAACGLPLAILPVVAVNLEPPLQHPRRSRRPHRHRCNPPAHR